MWHQDKDWDIEDSEEDDASEEELDPSDEDDAYYEKKPKVSRRGKGGHGVKSTKERKFHHGTGRSRRGKPSFEDDESSAEESESGSDEGLKSSRRKGAQVRKSNGRCSSSTSVMGRNSEVRTSSRSVRKVSYVESDESEEVEETKRKSQKVQSMAIVWLMLILCSNHMLIYSYLLL